MSKISAGPMTSQHGESRFLFRADDIQRQAGFAIDAFDEFPPVRRAAASLCGDGAGEGNAAAAKLLRTDRQRGQCAVDRGLAEPPVERQSLAEADDPGEGVDHDESVRHGAGYQQTAVVGAEVDSPVAVARSFVPLERGLGHLVRPDSRLGRTIGGLLRHAHTLLSFPADDPPPSGLDGQATGDGPFGQVAAGARR